MLLPCDLKHEDACTTLGGAVLDWYVLHSKPQKENWLYNQLVAREIEAYYPCVQTDDGKGYPHHPKPYFPGYLFVNLDLGVIGQSVLQWFPGSLGLVMFGGEPASLPEGLLQRIRQHVDKLNAAKAHMLQGLKPGDQVIIQSGPFANYEAVFCTQLHDSERVQVLLKILQDHTFRVNLPVHQIRAAKQHRPLL